MPLCNARVAFAKLSFVKWSFVSVLFVKKSFVSPACCIASVSIFAFATFFNKIYICAAEEEGVEKVERVSAIDDHLVSAARSPAAKATSMPCMMDIAFFENCSFVNVPLPFVNEF